MDEKNFLFVGVGGQGIILASDVVADVGLALGYDVKKSEIHGMSQRGGSVESHVRWASQVNSPVIGEGEVDYLIAMEILEAGRWARYVAPDGTVVINNQKITPMAVNTGAASYPELSEVERLFSPRTSKIRLVEGLAEARRLGNPAVSGVVLLGFLSSLLGLDGDAWKSVLRERVPKRFIDLNLTAFAAGRGLNDG